MRIWGVVAGGWLLPVLVWASPMPAPDPGYDGSQYIDGTGCVFIRSDAGWLARRDGQGAPICGFPPSVAAGHADGGAGPTASAPDALAAMLAEGLRDGELKSDPRPQEKRADPIPDPLQATMQQAVAARIAATEAARVVGARAHDGGVCALLGYRQVAGADAGTGVDVTQGLCPGMRADQPRLVANATAMAPQAAVMTAPVEERRPQARQAGRVDAPATGVARGRDVQLKSEISGDIVPAGARYVLLGAFADDGGYRNAASRLAAMGYAAARSSNADGGRLLLAGPFADREQVVRALNRLRESGYPGAVAR